MDNLEQLLRPLADTPEDYERDGGLVVLTRHGEEKTIQMVFRPGLGDCVRQPTPGAPDGAVPLATYIQRELFRLPTLATQIMRAIDRNMKQRPVRYIDSPARITRQDPDLFPEVARELQGRLSESTPGETGLFELMAPAGQGKTILLEHLANQFARGYQPVQHPGPLLLNVDLLGRYVGTLDDAIAGSLNNTYSFPSLSQRDVVYCIRQGWLVLALDGFDELAARIGMRDAFSRLSELLEQLDGRGTVVISARETFFDLYQVSTAVRNWVQPRKGAYSTCVVRLEPWTHQHGRDVFQQLGSKDPDSDLRDLLSLFGSEPALALHPFFLPKLAALWRAGERFADLAAQRSHERRTRYVIDTFITREVSEKWIDRDRRPVLSASGHTALLGVIAEEMWRANAFRLDGEELRLAGEGALTELKIALDSEAGQQILARLPTHAALAGRPPYYSFLHDRFFNYYLGQRIALLLLRGDVTTLRMILAAGEIVPDAVTWTADGARASEADYVAAIEVLNRLCADKADHLILQNSATLCAGILAGASFKEGDAPALRGMVFTGTALTARSFAGVRFRDCRFLQCDLSGSRLAKCEFDGCSFAETQIATDTAFGASMFTGCSFSTLRDVDAEITHFEPAAIEADIVGHGGLFALKAVRTPGRQPLSVGDEALRCVERFVKASERSTDIALDNIEHKCGSEMTTAIAKIGIATGVFKEVTKNTKGPKKHFVRFAVDRSRLLGGQHEPAGISQIEEFWKKVLARFAKKGSA